MFEPQKAEPALSAKGPPWQCWVKLLPHAVKATGRSLAREGFKRSFRAPPGYPEPQRPKPMNSSREPEVARACGWLYDS